MVNQAPLLTVLETGLEHGGLQTDDVLALVLPLLREVAALHEHGLVARLDGPHAYLSGENGQLQLLHPEGTTPSYQPDAVARIQAPQSSVLRVVGEARLTMDTDAGLHVENLNVATGSADATLTKPAYLCGYQAWERSIGHHDECADILCLGQVLASLACGLDFTTDNDLQVFAANRSNLFVLQKRLHPVIASVIVEMTELNRHERTRDLPSVLRRLQTYRDQPVDLAIDRVAGAENGADKQRRAVQTHLRDRLFDLSRRNRLLHFKPTNSSANLTVASVPLVVDLKSIRIDQLCVWDGRFAEEVLSGDRVPLARWLRFEDQPYLPGALDRIIQEARRDRAEYGFAQLSLVLAFLRWHDLKEAPDERVTSPLLLLPVDLTRKKGVRDQYLLDADTTEAQVNPVLRQHLRQLYGIVLPETVDLKTHSIARFHQDLQQQIAATEPGVQLRLIKQPEIELIHQRARQRLEQFRKRQRISAPVGNALANQDYNYAADDFRPRGLKLFHDCVRPHALPLRDAVGAPPDVRYPQMAGDTAEATTFALRESKGNPYLWDMDLTSVTIGNFNYRKMSLVRDYSAMLDTDMSNPAFDRVFSLQPKALEAEAPPPLPRAEQWAVVQADATQTAAVALARTGASYIIQGPPGTGKSQTITNLIADYVGRGKRVLFVCEKRAAIDVVYHRLHQQGLDELCCMIHDSQADKKSFVLNLKQTYEHWLAADDGHDAASRDRLALVTGMEQDLQALQRFDEAMRAVPAETGMQVRELVHRLVALHGCDPQLSARQAETLPAYASWLAYADLARRIHTTLRESFGVDALAEHVFARLGSAVIRHDRPLSHLSELCDRAEALLDRCTDVLANQPGVQSAALSVDDFFHLIEHARRAADMAGRHQLQLLEADSELSRKLDELFADMTTRRRALSQAAEKTTHWRDKLNPGDAQNALAQAGEQEKSMLRWLQPSWWRLSKIIKSRYDFGQHAIAPQFSQVLGDLVREQQAQAKVDQASAVILDQFGGGDPERLLENVRALRSDLVSQPALDSYHRQAGIAAQGCDSVTQLAALAPAAATLAELLAQLLSDGRTMTLDELGEIVRDLREQADSLPELLPVLLELEDAEPAMARALRQLPLTPDALEYAIAKESLEAVYRRERWLPRFDGPALARHVNNLGNAEDAFLGRNAQAIRAAVRRRFRDNIQRSSLAASQLDTEGKAFKKAYSAGRRELEHEFGKSMRYKAIRELASADTGHVVRDMKPIWLMSPLSVSDTLPLAPDLFDVVIFDEASQIPVEEAVPALYRAPQMIVVGDEMQLPPTSFFASGRDGDDDTLAIDEDGERLAVVLDADSLLSQGARNLPATLLAWHYRSRYESLIGFSNAAFYAGNLFTIPDRSLPASNLGDIEVHAADYRQEHAETRAATHTDALLERALSFHFVADALYANRANNAEAIHIAHMVRELLSRDTGHSLGIVAFSEAQQREIEAALETLADTDPVFAVRLEREYLREENDQFCGLIVKNLENVQGDERDVIILSICYGKGADGRMLMNFGPINQRGGEKRLNVIFSRARQHMAVVSSIRHNAITNDHNEGANALKQFLRYAECSSRGEREAAQQTLVNLNPLTRKALVNDGAPDEVGAQLAAALRERGYQVDLQVGQSRFRCDLGVRDATNGHYALGIMVDTAAHYANRNVFERYVSRPRILSAFGWRTLQVLASDWHHGREAVLARVERALQALPEVEAAPEEPREGAVEERLEETIAVMEPVAAQEAAAAEPVVAQEVAAAEPAVASVRRFEFKDGTSNKFWQIGWTDTQLTVTFGRIGTQGQTQLKQFERAERTKVEVEKLIGEKLRKGYVEQLAQK